MTGNYALTQVNGRDVLADFTQDDVRRFHIVAGTLLLRPDYLFTLRTTGIVVYETPGSLPQPFHGIESGSYLVSGSSITLTDSDTNTWTGVAGDILTLTVTPTNTNFATVVYTFQKW